MEYPNGLRHSSRYQDDIRAAHAARSKAYRDLASGVKDGVLASGRLLVSFLTRLFRWLDRTRQLRAARRELEAMDDHLLADLGISRQDIDDVVRNGNPERENIGEAPHPHEAKRAAELVDLRRERDLMGALIVHGPWSHYSDRPRKRDDAA